MIKGFFPHLEEIVMSKVVSPQTQESVEPEYLSHAIYKEINASKASYRLMEETPGTEEHQFEAYQERCRAEKY